MCWAAKLAPFEEMRDALRAGDKRFQYLDAAQLVKHAFGLVTDGREESQIAYLGLSLCRAKVSSRVGNLRKRSSPITVRRLLASPTPYKKITGHHPCSQLPRMASDLAASWSRREALKQC